MSQSFKAHHGNEVANYDKLVRYSVRRISLHIESVLICVLNLNPGFQISIYQAQIL